MTSDSVNGQNLKNVKMSQVNTKDEDGEKAPEMDNWKTKSRKRGREKTDACKQVPATKKTAVHNEQTKTKRHINDSEDDGESTDSDDPDLDNTILLADAKGKMPPIVVNQKITNITLFTSQIQAVCQQQVTFKYNRANVSVFTGARGDFHKVKELFTQTSVPHHTYTIKKDKPRHLVIKGLPNMDTNEIREDLAEQNIQTTKIIAMKQKSDPPYDYPLYMITLQNPDQVKEARKIKYINYFKVNWDKYKNTRKVTQCHRCQKFGHGLINCSNPPRCVKCTDPHLTKDCTKPQSKEPKCVNCDGNHPANYRSCTAYLTHLEKVQQAKQSRNAKDSPNKIEASVQHQAQQARQKTLSKREDEHPRPEPRNNDPSSSKYTYAAVATCKTQLGEVNTQKNINSTVTKKNIAEIATVESLVNEIKILNTLCDLRSMLSLVKKMNSKLQQCEDQVSKLLVISECVAEHG